MQFSPPAAIATVTVFKHVAHLQDVPVIDTNFLQDTLLLYARTAEIDCPSAVPGLSIPIGLAADQLPIGLQLHSRPGSPLAPKSAVLPFPVRSVSCDFCLQEASQLSLFHSPHALYSKYEKLVVNETGGKGGGGEYTRQFMSLYRYVTQTCSWGKPQA